MKELNIFRLSKLDIWYIPRERFLDPPGPPPPINFVHGSYRKCLDLPNPWPQRSAP